MKNDNGSYILYMHKNKINEKVYIGITSERDPKIRWGLNGTGYKPNKHFYAAIQKYGWDNFEHCVLCDSLNKDEACQKEIELISQYDSCNPDKGYNQSLGGDGYTFRHSERSKQKISQSITGDKNPNWNGRSNTPEQIEKLRQANLGTHHTEEHKKKIADAMRGKRHHTEKRKREMSEIYSVPVMRDDGIMYPSFRIAAKENGVTQPAISNAMKRNHRCAGHYWKYV